jgi:hypothetical protein
MSPDDVGPSSTADSQQHHQPQRLAAHPGHDGDHGDDNDNDDENDSGARPPDQPSPSQRRTRRRHASSVSSRSRQDAAVARARRRQKKSRKRRNPGLSKKLDFLTHLLKSLDLIVFAELSALYYMEFVINLIACPPLHMPQVFLSYYLLTRTAL